MEASTSGAAAHTSRCPVAATPDALRARYTAITARLDALELAVDLHCRWAAIHARIGAAEHALAQQAGAGADSCGGAAGTTTQPAAAAAAAAAAANRQAAYDAATAPGASAIQQRLAQELFDKGFSDFRFVRVAHDYYQQPLEARRAALQAASIDHLCKSIIMENTRAHPSVDGWTNASNSKYYVVIVQYTARLNADKLKNTIHKLNPGLGKQFFNMRLCPEDVSDALSGYEHNAVSPIGIKTPLPIILSHRIAQLQPDFFFLGAGEVDLKLGLPAAEFVRRYQPFVWDCTY